MPTITIDGKELEFEQGQTVIQVAHAAGIDVPHYCYHPGLSIAGNCRICMVEVEGWNGPQISCKLGASDGMVVHTESEVAKQGQAGTMEMLLVNHPLDCPICDQAGECHLQDYSYELGHGKSRATTPKTHLPKNVPFGENIVYDAERCIKCTLCVRFCEEITDTHELAMGDRSDNEIVIMSSKGEFQSNYSMNIVDICPVGALTSRDFRFQSRLWFMDFTASICTGCARGCNVTIGGRGGRFMRMEPRENQDVNRWWMCDPGRLGYGHVNSESRLATPAIRGKDGEWRAANWEEALTFAFGALAGRSSDDVLVDGGCSLEEMQAAKWLAASLGGDACFAAATGDDADDFLIVNEKGANAVGGEMLGLGRVNEPGKAAVLIVERDANVPAALRDASEAVVVFVSDAAHAPASARVAFPFGTWAERDGLMVNIDGKVQQMRAAEKVGPGNLMPAIEVFEELLAEADEDYVQKGRLGIIAAIREHENFANVEFPAAFAPDAVGAAR